MVKNNKTAIKGLLVLGGVSTAAASVFTLSKKYAKKLLYRIQRRGEYSFVVPKIFSYQTGRAS